MKKEQERKAFLSGLAERMRELMEGETQVSLAEKLGVSQGNIAKYLRGAVVPRADVLYRLMKTKGVNPAWLLTGQGARGLEKYCLQRRQKPPKASSSGRVSYGTSKEIRALQLQLEKLAATAPETLKEVKLFLATIENNVTLRGKIK